MLPFCFCCIPCLAHLATPPTSLSLSLSLSPLPSLLAPPALSLSRTLLLCLRRGLTNSAHPPDEDDEVALAARAGAGACTIAETIR